MKKHILLFGLVALSACLDVGTAPDRPSDPASETFASNLDVDIPNMQKTADGVYFKDHTVGTGVTLTSPATIEASYQAYLKDGSAIVALAASHGNLSLATSITGLQSGMLGMKEGGERLIVIPSALAFGNTLNPYGVPPNATLVFDIVFYRIE